MMTMGVCIPMIWPLFIDWNVDRGTNSALVNGQCEGVSQSQWSMDTFAEPHKASKLKEKATARATATVSKEQCAKA